VSASPPPNGNASAYSLLRTGLTIPLQITLSQINLSGFIILVFSRQKGLTLVFRNDPLESLKVSSTFDSIPFVRDYLQKEIAGQLRILLMDELPAIIHRLSLRLWVPEYSDNARAEREAATISSHEEATVDPFASPPQDPVDSHGRMLSQAEIASLSIETGIETQSLFSQRNLLRLATLTDSHRTLSLFTPSIRDVVFRAWATPTERGEKGGLRSPSFAPALSRSHSYSGSTSTTYTFDSASQGRLALHSPLSPGYAPIASAGRHGKTHGGRQRRKRVVNLRRQSVKSEGETLSDDASTFTDSASMTESTGSDPSILSAPSTLAQEVREQDIEPETPPRSPPRTLRQANRAGIQSTSRTEDCHSRPFRPKQPRPSLTRGSFANATGLPERGAGRGETMADSDLDLDSTPRASTVLPERRQTTASNQGFGDGSGQNEKVSEAGPSSAFDPLPLPNFLQFITDPGNGGTIAEQAWMMKMANEISRRYQEEREKGKRAESTAGDRGGEADAPPAYVG
jgi:mitochondrial distribution and morphology protein 34